MLWPDIHADGLVFVMYLLLNVWNNTCVCHLIQDKSPVPMLIRFPSTFLTISSATPTYNHFIQATSASWNFLGQAKYASALGPLHLLFALLAMPLLQIPI